MRHFTYMRIDEVGKAEAAVGPNRVPPTMAATQFLAGGTTILDLMKLDVMHPSTLLDINGLQRQYRRIETGAGGLYLGALVRMGEAAEHPTILRDYPVIAQSLRLAASQQIRNMATLGGNVLQRTRCNTSGIRVTSPATSGTLVPAARQLKASTVSMQCWALATAASLTIPGTLPRL